MITLHRQNAGSLVDLPLHEAADDTATCAPPTRLTGASGVTTAAYESSTTPVSRLPDLARPGTMRAAMCHEPVHERTSATVNIKSPLSHRADGTTTMTLSVTADDPLFSEEVVTGLTKDHLVRLATGTLACVHARAFLPAELRADLAGLVDRMPLSSVNSKRVNPPVLRFGPTVNDFVADGQLDPGYWTHVESARTAWAAADLDPDPLRICLEGLGEVWGGPPEAARIAGRPVMAGTIRESNGGLRVHFDDVAREFPRGLFDQKLVAQLAINVYLMMPSVGGETTIWRRTWEPTDEAARIGFGYDSEVVAGVQSVTVRPEPGDALVFNPRFYHSVAGGQDGRRVSVAMFIGITTGGNLAIWS
ncbi:hypothetical protein OOK41_14900 [Micromonospora sp. NBC_01655]|uniref:hypothetical protein n=1 Tax=Micromonospora sp. NBC_01655 TaxID=2975983 RepID=UPI00224D54E7|nr:hypothetical protein [Micromonospora sp. NBC_01655]MCX4471575.1 hypothetical protein [Micromonospora sp. NBC_01655]